MNAVEWICRLGLKTWKHRQSAKENPQELSHNHAAIDRVQRVAMGDLVFSQEDKPKRHWSAQEILDETFILRLSVHRIIHRILQLTCFK